MKKFAVIMLLLLFVPLAAYAFGAEEIIGSQMESREISDLSIALDKVKRNDFGEIIPDFNLKSAARSVAGGGWEWDIPSIMKRATNFFFKELFASMRIMASLVLLALFSALSENLRQSFGKDGIGNASFFACFFLIASFAVRAFLGSLSAAQAVIDDITVFITALIPTTLTLLATSGAVISAGIFHPVLTLCVEVVSLSVRNVIIPLILISTALSLANGISEKAGVGRLAKIFKTAVKWILGIMLTVFAGVVAIQSLAAPALDGISVKTARFAVGNFVPVVGNVLAESVDLAFGCGAIIKNAVGVSGLIAILSICAAPLLRLLSQAFMLSLTAAVIEPVSDERIAGIISETGEAVMTLFVTVLIITFMFIINIAIIVGAGNTATVFGR
ncbi:MAG: Stage III sporulation protein AE precursor [Firmicutes bacterium ADurb.Bin193]|nr:MAG: Stage III sporulation protein AE precursor [Firmicutes bacterium ADurb.Bin193]